MALCDKCAFMDKRYDQFRQDYNDAEVIGERTEQHFCPMYNDHIPEDIYYGNGDCVFYDERTKNQL